VIDAYIFSELVARALWCSLVESRALDSPQGSLRVSSGGLAPSLNEEDAVTRRINFFICTLL
jgi:hypothetical protein